ncbi:MAG: hypothetical protein CENE_03529 [Candidatus Celerinatantimonas neptuna]|nr:MAG: hypothetical protein CENE_03529 [Candidatus Celerinatantimonas neptuna]
MKILVDADACPAIIRDILVRFVNKQQIKTIFIANQPVAVKRSSFVSTWQVSQGIDVADQEIIRRACEGDLVVTQDLRLAQAVLTCKAMAISPRGELFDRETIDSKVSRRDFNEVLRESGVLTGGPSALSGRDSQRFAEKIQQLSI